MFKTLWNWIWDIDGARTTDVISRSVSGFPLVVLERSAYGWSLNQTPQGLQGAHLAICITQLGENVEVIKKFLRKEYDDYFSEEDYKRLAQMVFRRLNDGGYYISTERNKNGSLDLVRVPWKEEDKETIRNLLASHWEIY